MKSIKLIVLGLIGFGSLAIVGGLVGEAIGKRVAEICENE